ncbi:MAG TPA: glycerol-3-phosphate 1-O-acyltransferase PlsY [Mariprofundaceae bacterium]|nr:glycerol-3-phosphate 1-O-acyltransferase PlsY [Mariprofundaceae bacterium]
MNAVTALAIVGAYLLGAIPFGLLFSKLLTNRDPREFGSGNIGATNAMRTGGKLVGALTLLADIGKGALAVGLAVALAVPEWLIAAIALAAFLGHIFPVYLRFKGGKGVATMFGVMLPWQPWLAVLAFAIWLAALKLGRYVSLASILAGLSLPVAGWLLHVSPACMVASLLFALLMTWRHEGNIRRLLAGTEPKSGGKSSEARLQGQ